MIQLILLFSLGFLSATFLALVVAPTIWRRAVHLTRQRIEASVPLTLNEIQAGKDRLRAEHAMTERRLEIALAGERHKVSSKDSEIGRLTESARQLGLQLEEKAARLGALDTEVAGLVQTLGERDASVAELERRIEAMTMEAAARSAEITRLQGSLDEAQRVSSGRQADLAAREAQVEKLHSDIEAIRAARRETEVRLLQAEEARLTASEGLAAERAKAAQLGEKHEKLIALASDRVETLERRDRDIARLREEVKELRAKSDQARAESQAAQKAASKLEADLGAASAQLQALTAGESDAEVEKARKLATTERRKIERQAKAAEAEAALLRKEIDALKARAVSGSTDDRRGDDLLRVAIGDLAAKMAHLTAEVEGPDSPIHAALAARSNGGAGLSLADRIRALQAASEKYQS